MICDQLSSAAIEQVDRAALVLIAVAATEQHGPHLSLATAVLMADSLKPILSDLNL